MIWGKNCVRYITDLTQRERLTDRQQRQRDRETETDGDYYLSFTTNTKERKFSEITDNRFIHVIEINKHRNMIQTQICLASWVIFVK